MASLTPMPLMPPKATGDRLEHFDPLIYKTDSSSLLYRIVDAVCGDSGAGSLKKEIFLQRLGGALEGIYYSDLDYIFGNMHFLSRAPSESYSYNPSTQMLTSDQWDEVAVKDAWFRSRIKDFFVSCSLGGTSDGFRMAVQAAISSDCTLFETWRYMDWDLSNLGRSPQGARNEVVIRPHKDELSPKETRLLRQMLDAIAPTDCIVTVNELGLSVSAPVEILAAAADSTYYQVEKIVTPAPVLESIPAPELLAIDLDPTEKWLFSKSPELAPYAAFNISSESANYYLASGGPRSPIDSVTYGTLQSDGTVKPEPDFAVYADTGTYSEWRDYDLADSPDNYPGGKFGLHPDIAPAINPDGTPYTFAYSSQADYVDERKAAVLAQGGEANDLRYRLPIEKQGGSKITFTPDLAVAWTAPVTDSTVTSSWTGRRPRVWTGELRGLSAFVRA